MPSPSEQLLDALKDFLKAVNSKGEPGMLYNGEINAGRALTQAIEQMIQARVDATVKAYVSSLNPSPR